MNSKFIRTLFIFLVFSLVVNVVISGSAVTYKSKYDRIAKSDNIIESFSSTDFNVSISTKNLNNIREAGAVSKYLLYLCKENYNFKIAFLICLEECAVTTRTRLPVRSRVFQVLASYIENDMLNRTEFQNLQYFELTLRAPEIRLPIKDILDGRIPSF